MKKFLVSMTTACFLFSFGNITVLSDPGEPIGTIISEDETVVEKEKKEKLKKPKNGEPRLDPGEPIGT
ncbi:hypothetical protein [Bacillus suaedaesalsae]|uniref:Uncharacterized protein n=1 Tax=Bacillus suaedaesalsae TaxID=2810349 RepID=A0ABS2DG71_9BACI|nr:hypothetical protein [Bacillus suaedaesalsae]MBM6616541.1 hypothetical protein [Bacillus suaedaesalsae]